MKKGNIQRNLLEKLSSTYNLKIVYSYIPFNSFLNLIKYNKSIHKKLKLSLYQHQKYFFQEKLCINYGKITIDKLIKFLQKEFNKDFSEEKNKRILNKIIEEIKLDKTFFKEDILNIPKEKSKIILLTKNIELANNYNILELSIQNINYPQNEQIAMPSATFHNLKKLNIDSNCIIPASLLINLENLFINIVPYNDILFINDINKEILDLDKLKYIQINYNKKNICSRCNTKDTIIMDDMHDEYVCTNCGLVYEDPLEYKEKKIICPEKKYKIKFNFKNLERFIIEINMAENFSFILDYFGLDSIYNVIDKKENRNDINNINENLKEVFLNMEPYHSMKYFKFIALIKRKRRIQQSFKMKISKGGKKNFTFQLQSLIKNSYWNFYKEKYEEKNLKYFKNYDEIRNYNISIEKLNFLGMKCHKNSDPEKIDKLFELKDNNYSIQEIVVNFENKKICIDNLIKNISKFRAIQNLVIFDKIRDKNIFMNFIEDISKLELLDVIEINCYEKLEDKEKNSIIKLLPKATIGDYSVKQNFKNVDYNINMEI